MPESDASVPEDIADPGGAARPASAPPALAADSSLPGTILSIQVLRFLAALSVVLFHGHLALVGQVRGHVPDEIDHAFEVGASGVHVFFVISGFVMVYTSWRSRLTPGNFLSRRLIRIYPIYWVAAAAYLVAHQLMGTAYNLGGKDILGAALLLPGYSPLIIGPGWTLTFEMYFYLCFAAALFMGLRRGLVALSAFYAACFVAGLFFRPPQGFLALASDSLLLEFMAGGWLGYAFAKGLKISQILGAAFVAMSIGMFAAGFWVPHGRIPSVLLWGVPSLLLVSGTLAFEAQLRSVPGRFLAKLGDSSYLLYLSHVLIIDLLIATPIASLDANEQASDWLTAPATLVCVIIAAIGYKFVELPLLNLAKRLVGPRRGNARVATTATV